MTYEELVSAYNKRLDVLERHPELKSIDIENACQFIIPTPKRILKGTGYYPLKIRTPFGMCRWYPCSSGVLIWPTLTQVKKLINKIELELTQGPRAVRGKDG